MGSPLARRPDEVDVVHSGLLELYDYGYLFLYGQRDYQEAPR